MSDVLPLRDQTEDPPVKAGGLVLYAKAGLLYVRTLLGGFERLARIGDVAGFTTGDAKLTWKVTADDGWVMANDGTIGRAGSGATTRANADTEALYTLLWTNISDTHAPVTGGRGASAAADFAAGKPLALPKALGRAIAVAGAGAGLTPRALGSTYGQETVGLTAENNGPHTHSNRVGTGAGGTGWFGTGTAADSTEQTGSSGNGTPHENVPPETFMNVMVKL